MPSLHALLFAGAAALLAAPIAAQQPQLIVDINQTPLTQPFDSNPRPLARLGGEVLLQARTPFHGAELWAMDLVTRNVRLVADLVPGTGGSVPFGDAVLLGSLWFAAHDASGQRELWRSNGTQAGTSRLLDIGGPTSSSPREIRVVNSRLAFVADGGFGVGAELFVSDGTAAGTQVIDIHQGPASSDPSGLFVLGGHVYFAATRPGEGRALWRSDGTVAGTQLVMDPAPGSAADGPVSITAFNNQLLFGGGGQLWLSDGTAAGSVAIAMATVSTVAATATTICYVAGQGLFATNGTPGTAQQIATLPGFSWPPAPIQAFGQRFLLPFFSSFGSALTYLSDGTAAGTFVSAVSAELEFAVLGNRIYFGGNDFSGSGPVLWSSDGTLGGTAPVGGGFDPEALFAIPGTGQLLFSGVTTNPGAGRELWGSDGTAAGTTLIANIAAENLWSQGSDPEGFVDAAGTLFFVAETGTTSSLWRSDGTAAGTIALGSAAFGANPGRLAAVGTRVYYVGYDTAHGAELWVSDGTSAGTRLVHDALPGPGSGGASYLVAADDWLYYLAPNGIWRGLWRTDGTAAGTVPIVGWGTIDQVEPLGRGLVFTLWQPGAPMGLYYTDGTQAGTVRLADLAISAVGAQLDLLERVGNRVFATGFFRDRLFVTDGTQAGTVELTAAMTAPPQDIHNLVAFEGQLVFQAFRPGGSTRFWTSDGSAAGTQEWFVPTSSTDLFGYAPKVMGDLILWNNSVTLRMWRTDGTAAGTFPLSSQEAHYIEPIGDHEAWFSAAGPSGAELWRTDGTAAGTVQVADIVPGPTSSFVRGLTLSSGKLFFGAAHPQFGNEPWVIDVGTNHQQVGYSCSAHGTAGPELVGSDPVLGTTMTLSVRGGPDPGISLALLDNHTTGTSLIGVGYCARFINPGSYGWSVEFFQNGLVQHALPIPNNPTLVGMMFRTQALVLGAGGIPELEVSNGVAFEIGN